MKNLAPKGGPFSLPKGGPFILPLTAVNRADIQALATALQLHLMLLRAVTSNFRSALYKILLDHLHRIISADFIQPISDSLAQTA